MRPISDRSLFPSAAVEVVVVALVLLQVLPHCGGRKGSPCLHHDGCWERVPLVAQSLSGLGSAATPTAHTLLSPVASWRILPFKSDDHGSTAAPKGGHWWRQKEAAATAALLAHKPGTRAKASAHKEVAKAQAEAAAAAAAKPDAVAPKTSALNHLRYCNPAEPGAISFAKAVDGFPKGEWWKLWVDKDMQGGDNVNNPKLRDILSANYSKSMMEALFIIQSSMGQRVDSQFLGHIHTAVVSSKHRNQARIGPAEGKHHYYHFKYELCSDDAKAEWVAEKLVFVPHTLDEFFPHISAEAGHADYSAFYNHRTKKIVSRLGFQPEGAPYSVRNRHAYDQVNWRWDEYYACINAVAHDDVDKTLACIARVVRSMLIFHPFPNGNGRVFQTNILTKLLIENGESGVSAVLPVRGTVYLTEKRRCRLLSSDPGASISWRLPSPDRWVLWDSGDGQ
jgi:hypothetical protein